MINLFKVIKPGLSTSVQDLGRTGFQQYGLGPAGAMDSFALQIGNILVGNERGEAGLEIAIHGPKLKVLTDVVLAICGADLSPRLDGNELPLWKTFQAKAGQIVSFGKPKSGVYAYITVANGIYVPEVMKSKSTYTKANLGGFQGRILKKDDVLQGNRTVSSRLYVGRGLSSSTIPTYQSNQNIRVILGPEHESFKAVSLNSFLKEEFEVTRQSDRMGYRLTGPALSHKISADIISDTIFRGTIQVPASGKPIIMLADRQTIGGYTRIATVIAIDLPYVAQKLPGNRLSFTSITVEEAQELFIKQEKLLIRLSMNS